VSAVAIPPIEIVRAEARHIVYVAPLFDAYRRFYGKPSDLEGAARFLTSRLGRGESTVFLATAGSAKPAAAAGFVQAFHGFSSLRMRPAIVLNELYVAPEWRGKTGIAAALVKRVHELAGERGAETVALETAAGNARARRLYERLGYRRDDMLRFVFDVTDKT
jgi:ribosomal protein S18 acetylase RimI-like enzyme